MSFRCTLLLKPFAPADRARKTMFPNTCGVSLIILQWSSVQEAFFLLLSFPLRRSPHTESLLRVPLFTPPSTQYRHGLVADIYS